MAPRARPSRLILFLSLVTFGVVVLYQLLGDIVYTDTDEDVQTISFPDTATSNTLTLKKACAMNDWLPICTLFNGYMSRWLTL